MTWRTCADFAPHEEGYLPAICCSSCHEDWELGYDEPIFLDPEDIGDGGSRAEVCCAISRLLADRLAANAVTPSV